jgi:hypothetical protein
MADTPPVLPTAPPGGPGAPAGWENTLDAILHGLNPGRSPAPVAAPSASGAGSAGPPLVGFSPEAERSERSTFTLDFWERLKQDLEVYGFLFLLVGIGLYGLFAPQVNTVVQTAAAVAAKRK